MKLSLQWLRELIGSVQSDISDTDILNALEQLGYEVESIKSFNSKILSNIKVVKVLSVNKHPNADKLTVCKITDGVENKEIVCGAPNVYEGMYAAYVPSGAVISGNIKVEKRKIRGIISEGMLCSAKELDLYDDHSGILELDSEFQLGSTLDKYFHDKIVEVSTPANRYDCLGHLLIAKELAVKFKLDFKMETDVLAELENKKLPFFDVKISSYELCKRYIAIQINNVNNKVKLPFRIMFRLNSLGLRSINPIVDISNYVMLEVGHSVHIFDYDKISNGKILVRKAINGEEILALDGKSYVLNEEVTVIADDVKPIAIAGIIGGENSCVDENTTNLLIESAVFNRSKIRIARKTLGINTEAAYRFERGSGWNLCELAAGRVYQLILKHCGGQVTKFSDMKDVEYYNNLMSYQHSGIKTDLNFISSLLGVEVDNKEFIDIMRRIGFEVRLSYENLSLNRQVYLLPPVNRQDIKFQADIAEEYLRFTGYESVPETLPTSIQKFVGRDDIWFFVETIIKYLVSMGLTQVVNYSLCSSKENEIVVNVDNKKVLVLNPVSKEFSELRLSLLPSLLRNLNTNYNNQVENVALFELGKVFYKTDHRTTEELQLGIIAHGEYDYLGWQHRKYKYDLYFICGVIETLFKYLGIDFIKEVKLNSNIRTFINKEFFVNTLYYIEKRTMTLLSFVGELQRQKLKLKLPQNVYYAEIYIEELMKFVKQEKIYQPLPKYPFVIRDLCFIVPEKMNFWRVEKMINDIISSEGLIHSLGLKDLYKRDDKTFITITLQIQDRNKTLTDEETNIVVNKIIDVLEKNGLQLRRE
ncbi:MAG: phenylalanine--tRNA ligase subunit beta [Endomicrobia bacterium]|nr:phenylalanine--tRNA ligase subunit beta [Endomicrobiia bacterium]